MTDPASTIQQVSDVLTAVVTISSAISAFLPLPPQFKILLKIINVLALNVKNAKNAKDQ